MRKVPPETLQHDSSTHTPFNQVDGRQRHPLEVAEEEACEGGRGTRALMCTGMYVCMITYTGTYTVAASARHAS